MSNDIAWQTKVVYAGELLHEIETRVSSEHVRVGHSKDSRELKFSVAPALGLLVGRLWTQLTSGFRAAGRGHRLQTCH